MKKTINNCKNKKSATNVQQSKLTKKCDNQSINIKNLVNPVLCDDAYCHLKKKAISNEVLIQIPDDDVEINIISRKETVFNNGVPLNIEEIYTDNLLSKLCTEFYVSNWIVTSYKDLHYNGFFWSLPNVHKELFPTKEQKFSIDDEKEKDNDNTFTFQTKGIYLDSPLAVCTGDDYQRHMSHKEDASNSNKGTVTTYAKRYVPPRMVLFCLSELSDGTRILKESLPREGRTQEIIYVETIESLNGLDGFWIVLSFKTERKPLYLYTNSKENQDIWLKNLKAAVDTPVVKIEISGTDESLERIDGTIHEMLQKILLESEKSAITLRNEDHLKILTLSSEIIEQIKKKSPLLALDDAKPVEKSVLDNSLIRPQVEQIIPRFYFKLTGRRFLTSVNYSPDNKCPKDMRILPEPFFISCCLIHLTDNRRISEEFQWNPNHATIENLLPKELFTNRWCPKQGAEKHDSVDNDKTPSDLPTFSNHALQNCKSFIVKSPYKHDQIGILIRIDKVFNGPMTSWIDKYVKSGTILSRRRDGEEDQLLLDNTDSKSGQSIYKSMATFCGNIGHYRMPFCWSFSALSRRGPLKLPLYRYDSSKTSDEDLFKVIHNLNQDSTNRVLTIPGVIEITIEEISESKINDMTNLVNSELICKRQSIPSAETDCCKEIKEFIFDPLYSLTASSNPHYSSAFDNSSSSANNSRPNSNFVSHPDETSSGDLTPSGDMYNSSFFSPLAVNAGLSNVVIRNVNSDGGAELSSDNCLDSIEKEDLLVPFLDFTHSLYVYPRTLNFSNQNIFHRARNLSCFVELRSSDKLDASVPLNVIFSRPSSKQPAFDSWANTSVTYHDSCPTFNEEIKLALPINLSAKHHLLFRFYHVSCDTAGTTISKDKSSIKKSIETPVGFAWISLLDKNLNLKSGTFNLPVAVSLVSDYLEDSNRTTHVQWVDGQKPIFSIVLKSESSIYTQNVHLHRFFRICSEKCRVLMLATDIETKNGVILERSKCGTKTPDQETDNQSSNATAIENAVKTLAMVDVTALILFLGPTFNQLLTIVVNTCYTYPKLSQTATMSVITLFSTLRGQSVEVLSGRAIRRNTTLLKNYVKYSFDVERIVPEHCCGTRTVHGSIVQTILGLSQSAFRDSNFLHSFLHNSFLLYSLIAKSMIQSKLKHCKSNIEHKGTVLFADSFITNLDSMIQVIVDSILDLCSNNTTNQQGVSSTLRNQSTSVQSLSSSANKDLARFLGRLFNVMEPGFLFRLIYQYMKIINARIKLHAADNERFTKMKFEFLEIICQHEYFIPLNMISSIKATDKDQQVPETSLSETFCQEHYLIGLLLQQVHQHMCNTLSSNAVKRLPIILLRNLLAKHTFDDRYQTDEQQFRIARLYLPLISIVLENQKALSMPGTSHSNRTGTQIINDPTDKSVSSRQYSVFSLDTMSTHSSIDGSGSEGGGGSIYGVGTGAGALQSKSTRSSQAYLDKEGRVESHFLNMIAGLTNEGRLRDISTRRQLESDTSSVHSTSTLTGIEEFEDGDKTSLADEVVIHTKIELNESSMRRGSQPSVNSSNSSYGRKSITPITLNIKRSATSSHSAQRMSAGLGVNAVTAGLIKNPDIKSTLWLNDKTQKDLFLCLMYVFGTVSTEDIEIIVTNLTVQERAEFLQLLIYSIHHLKYQGKKAVYDLESISRCGIKSGIGQARMRSKTQKKNDAGAVENPAILDGNLSTEVGIIVLHVLSVYCNTYKQEILTYNADHALFRRIVEVYLNVFVVNQSDTVLRNTLVSMRIFVTTFAKVIFASCHSVICDLSLHVLRLCDARSTSVRTEACGFLYRMMRSSYELFGKPGFNRVHLQMIVAVSKLDRNVGRRFNQSLIYLKDLAELEMKKSLLKPTIKPKPLSRSASVNTASIAKMNMQVFYEEVSDLTQRIRTVLMATVQMNEHKDDPEMLVDLQYSLATSYSSNPALRRTWLEKICAVHEKTHSKAEIAMCKAHIVAMICEYLQKKELYSIGCADFQNISPNIPKEEMSMQGDSAQMEVHYSKEEVVLLLREVSQAFDVAGLWEILRHIYNLIIPIYMKKKDYEQLSQIYKHLSDAFTKIKGAEVNNQRLIGSYYLVVFYGNPFESLAGKRFIYRLDSGKQFCVAREELQGQFQKKYGAEKVNMLDETYVNLKTLDQNLASIHVTHVDPFFDDEEELERQSMFERQYNISKFMLETPFVKESLDDMKDILKSKQTEDLSIQWKRRTIMTVEANFPHLKRRLEVVSTKEIDFSPIERAIDEIKSKNRELVTDLLLSKQSNVNNKLVANSSSNSTSTNPSNHSGNINLLMDMHLAGALLPQVNQGPMAYVRVFLQKEIQLCFPTDKVRQLKIEFMEFLSLCHMLLLEYYELMSHIHEPKYRAMCSALDKYRIELSNLLNEEIAVDYEHMIICTGQLSDHVLQDLMQRLGRDSS